MVWIQSFSSPRLVALPRLKNPNCLTGGRGIHAFPKGIGAKWSTNSFIQDLNTGCQFHFLWWSAQLAGAVECTKCISAEEWPHPHPWYDTKQSNGAAPVMLELWKTWNASSLLSLPSPLWLGVVAPGSNRTVWHLNWVQTNDL